MKAYQRSQLEMYARDAEALKGILAIIEECEGAAIREAERPKREKFHKLVAACEAALPLFEEQMNDEEPPHPDVANAYRLIVEAIDLYADSGQQPISPDEVPF